MATTTSFLRTSASLTPNFIMSSVISTADVFLRGPSNVGFCARDMSVIGDTQRKPVLHAKATVTTSDPKIHRGLDLTSVLANVADTVLQNFKLVTKPRPWNLHVQMFIEKVIINCRFFTWFAVGGSLLGSALCFVEGCFNVLETYFEYFHALSQRSDQGHVVQHLIEAIDMFMLGTAMLIFGMGLHVMFVGSRNLKEKIAQLPPSNLFGLFYLKTLPTWVGMQSVEQANSRIGHAVMMILQAGVLEKFKSIPLVTGLDLACFAGAVLLSSACIFLLSRLSIGGIATDR